MRSLSFAVYTIVLFLAVLGCGKQSAPILPCADVQGNVATSQQSPSIDTGRYFWGIWEIEVSADRRTVRMTPLRVAAFHLNVVRMLEVSPCTNCLTIGNLVVTPPSSLSVDLTLRHPFDKNLNLTGFDVRGVFISNGDFSFPGSGRELAWGAGVPRILNADGYTTLFNPTEYPPGAPGPPALKYIHGKYSNGIDMTATLNPFIAYAKDLPRRMFLSGTEETRTVNLALPTGGLKFGYAVDASWKSPPGTVIDPEIDFPPDANSIEAYAISVQMAGEIEAKAGSSAPILVEAFDHQGIDTIDTVTMECPPLFDNQASVSFSTITGEDSALFTATVFNDKGAPEGDYPLLVRVRDISADTNLGPIDAWQVRRVSVKPYVPPLYPPVANASAEPLSQVLCEDIQFHDDGSFDPDGGAIVKYEWDWDDDGTYDEEGANVVHSWDSEGTYYVQFRVTDDEGVTATLAAPIQVDIANALPTAIAQADKYNAFVGETINFDGSGSYDNDCSDQSIVSWEWDWTNDGVFEGSGEFAGHSYPDLGTYYVQLRVTDNEATTDLLDATLQINVGEQSFPPVAMASPEPLSQVLCEDIQFHDDGSYDPDGGAIVKYEWDWDNDGTFDEEGSNVIHSWDSEGTYYVQFRVTDDDGETDELDQPLAVEVMEYPPTAVAVAETVYVGQPVVFDASGSHDNDCFGQWIQHWEWDFNFDNNPDALGEIISKTYFGPGEGEVMLRVRDDEWDYDDLDEPLHFTVLTDPTKMGWARTWGGESGSFLFISVANSVALDDAGYVYAAGDCINATFHCPDLDPGPGIDIHVGYGSINNPDAFLVKYDSSGAYQWGRTWGSVGREHAYSTCVDSAGSIYVTGYFGIYDGPEAPVDFDPGPGVIERTTNGSADIFVSKFDSDGNFQWVLTWGGLSLDIGMCVDTDASNNLYVAGVFGEVVDFDPGDGVDLHTASLTTDAFVASFDSSGAFRWARTWGGDEPTNNSFWSDVSTGVAVDDSGSAWVTGYFAGTDVDFDPGPGEDLHSTAEDTYSDAFLSKFDSSGQFQWARTWGGDSTDETGDQGTGVAIDSEGNSYVGGIFLGTVDFDPGPGVDLHQATPYSYGDCFLSKFDPDGLFEWAATWGSSGREMVKGVAVNDAGYVFAAGYFGGSTDFDPGPGVDVHVPLTYEDPFLSVFNSTGEFQRAQTWGGIPSDPNVLESAKSVACDDSGNSYVAGNYTGPCDFCPGPDVETHECASFSDAFLVKFGPDGNW